MMSRKIRIREMYDSFLDDNIMTDLLDYDVPWKNDVDITNPMLLDMGYAMQSAGKLIAPIMRSFVDFDSDYNVVPMSDEERQYVAGIVFTLYNVKWSKLYALLSMEYNPISNYDMTETETINRETDFDSTDTGTVIRVNDTNTSNTATHTGTDTNVIDSETSDIKTQSGTVTNVLDEDTTNTGTVTDSGSRTVDDGVFGFNSSEAVDTDTSTETKGNTRTNNLTESKDSTNTETRNLSDINTGTVDTTETQTKNLTDTDSGEIDTTDTETRNLAGTNNGSEDTERELHRSGNIGVTTTQQMMQSEIELWQWNFFKTVFDDIDKVCCLDIY